MAKVGTVRAGRVWAAPSTGGVPGGLAGASGTSMGRTVTRRYGRAREFVHKRRRRLVLAGPVGQQIEEWTAHGLAWVRSMSGPRSGTVLPDREHGSGAAA